MIGRPIRMPDTAITHWALPGDSEDKKKKGRKGGREGRKKGRKEGGK
jgi:hypothetical protein